MSRAISQTIGRSAALRFHDTARPWSELWRRWRRNLRDRDALTLLGEHERGRIAADIGVTPAELTAALARPPSGSPRPLVDRGERAR